MLNARNKATLAYIVTIHSLQSGLLFHQQKQNKEKRTPVRIFTDLKMFFLFQPYFITSHLNNKLKMSVRTATSTLSDHNILPHLITIFGRKKEEVVHKIRSVK